MKKDPSQMTNEERWGRVGELLYKGVYLLAIKEKQQTQIAQIADNKPLTLQESATKLGVSHRTIQRWVATGKIIPVKKAKGRRLVEARQIRQLRILRGDTSPLEVTETAPVVTKPVFSHTGIVAEKIRGKNKGRVLSLICPNDKKRLAELPLDYFDAEEGKGFLRNKRKVFVHCSKCKLILEF